MNIIQFSRFLHQLLLELLASRLPNRPPKIYVQTKYLLPVPLANVSAVAITRAVELPKPALITVWVQSQEPSVQRLLEIVQVLRLTMVLTILRARVIICQSPTSVQTSLIAFREESIVVAHHLDRIVVVIVQLVPQKCSAGIDTLRDVVRALSVRVVGACDLHQAWCWATGISVARGFLHGDECQEHRIDLVFVARLLESPIVLLAGRASVGIEGWAVDLDEGVPGQEGCLPAIGFHAGVDPVLRSVKIVRRVV